MPVSLVGSKKRERATEAALGREGVQMNHQKFRRLYREERLIPT
jgi:hypothetical protein